VVRDAVRPQAKGEPRLHKPSLSLSKLDANPPVIDWCRRKSNLFLFQYFAMMAVYRGRLIKLPYSGQMGNYLPTALAICGDYSPARWEKNPNSMQPMVFRSDLTISKAISNQ
jgi:hypothetical protein